MIFGDVLVLGETKRSIPVIMIKVDLIGVSRVDRTEPIVKDDMVLMSDLACVHAEYERNRMRVGRTEGTAANI